LRASDQLIADRELNEVRPRLLVSILIAAAVIALV
jgi:hypothetical protein